MLEHNLNTKVALVGNPNVGKSVIFGVLTGAYANVSNYPGTTVEVSRGSAEIKGKKCLIIDTPGVNSIVPASEDERVTRDILLNDHIDYIALVADSKNLKRALVIATELAEMSVPCALALNMYDEAGERGIHVDAALLEKKLSIPVVPVIATQRWNVDKFKERVFDGAVPLLSVQYPPAIEAALDSIVKLLPASFKAARAVALMLLGGDKTLEGWVRDASGEQARLAIEEIRKNAAKRYAEPLGYIINKERLRYADSIVKDTVRAETKGAGPLKDKLGTLSMHPVWGFVFLALVLGAMYGFVGVLGAGYAVDFITSAIFGKYLVPWTSRVVEYVVGPGFIKDLLVGPYGLVSMAFTYAIAIVLPIVGSFFIFFGLLEDSGYLPRLAVMVDRAFRRMGLNGKAVLPMVLGLGCGTMATMTARILETRKERIIVTLLLALGIPCSAQLGVIMGMLSAISLWGALVWCVSIIIVIVIVSYLASLIVKGGTSDFVLEIPPFRAPKPSNIALKTLVRVEWYLKEAVPLFILGTLTLFTADKLGLVSLMERWSAPLFETLLSLPREVASPFVLGFLRRDYGAAGLFMLQKNGLLDGVQTVVSLVTMTLFVPCIANFFMIIKERGIKVAFWMALFIFPAAVLAGALLNFILRLFGAAF
ncbi:MAG: ferrous iron transport protein B [Deltaproteobacteria bacterium]|nr:ferrous iron transport protein B [Deltaproteobacteria bacterium]